MATIRVGSHVQYSAKFLRSIGAFTGSLPFAKGVVQELSPLGETILADVKWDTGNIPTRINVENLHLIGVPEHD